MKFNKFAALFLSLALVLSTPIIAAGSSNFTDVPDNHWALTYINSMFDKGVMKGTGNGKFDPDKTLSYAEFFTMVTQQFYKDKIGAAANPWYTPYVKAAEGAGITKGITYSSPDDSINRYEMSVVMYNVLAGNGTKLSDTSKVADWASVPAKYQDAVSVCYNMGMLTGVDNKGTFNGDGLLDRSQAAVVMTQLIDKAQPDPVVDGNIIRGARKQVTDKDVTLPKTVSYNDGVFTSEYVEEEYVESLITVNVSGYDFLNVIGSGREGASVKILNGDKVLAANALLGDEEIMGVDVKGLDKVTVRLVTYAEDERFITMTLGNYDTVVHNIPAGALELTDKNTKIIGEGSSYKDGVFTLKNDGFSGSGGYIEFTNPGKSMLTFTIVTYGRSHNLGAGCLDSIVNTDPGMRTSIEPGVARTYMVDIGDGSAFSIWSRALNSRICDATITNIYLT